MSLEKATLTRPVRVIVVGNEKGGSGKSTVAMHIAMALIKSGQSVATLDLDSRQRSFTHYIENRRAWAQHVGRDLEIPNHTCFDPQVDYPSEEDEATGCQALTDAVDALAQSHRFIVIDTPGHDSDLMRRAHAMADTLITPLNDSFVDLEVLQELSQRLNFRCIEGLAERVIFREFYPRGLTAVDDLDEITLGTRPTMSHVTARLEIENLLSAMGLADSMAGGEMMGQARDAA